jgi:hypothetical protein
MPIMGCIWVPVKSSCRCKSSGPLLSGVAPCRLDLDQLRTGGKLALDMGCELGMEIKGVTALLTLRLYIGEEGGVVPGAAWADTAGSGYGVEGGVLTVERRIGKGQEEIGLYPCGDVLGGK